MMPPIFPLHILVPSSLPKRRKLSLHFLLTLLWTAIYSYLFFPYYTFWLNRRIFHFFFCSFLFFVPLFIFPGHPSGQIVLCAFCKLNAVYTYTLNKAENGVSSSLSYSPEMGNRKLITTKLVE